MTEALTRPQTVYEVRVQIDGQDQPFTINQIATFYIEEALREGVSQLPHFPPGKEQDITITIRKIV